MGGGQLPSWRETAVKEPIVEFVAAMTNPDSAGALIAVDSSAAAWRRAADRRRRSGKRDTGSPAGTSCRTSRRSLTSCCSATP